MEEKDVKWLAALCLVIFVSLGYLTVISLSQYQKGFRAGVEHMSNEPEDTRPDHGKWRLPHIRIEEVD